MVVDCRVSRISRTQVRAAGFRRNTDLINTPGGKTVKLSIGNNSVEFNWTAIECAAASGKTSFTFITYNETHEVREILHQQATNRVKLPLASNIATVVSTSTSWCHISSNITLTFPLIKNPKEMFLCVRLSVKRCSTIWTKDGCEVLKFDADTITCRCNQLSTFTVLERLHATELADEANLQMVTTVGTALSLVCLLLSLIAFSFCRTTDNIRITIHSHLCLSLFLAEVLFVIDFDRHAHRSACMAVAIMLHYLFLACFAWMLLEGVQLYLMVVKVFHSRSLQPKYLYLCGYGSPVIIVAITMAVNIQAYGTETHCWLNIESGYIWAFLGPACVILGINAFFFGITIWKLIGKFSMLSTDVPHFKKVRSFTCTAIAQLVILGGTWILGFFHFTDETTTIAYIFTTANSLQGVFIFVLHCLMCKQVRSEFLNGISKINEMTHQRTHLIKSLGVQKTTETTATTPC
ncbi:hypothetical protein scyTo_0010926 [Scyliorhinus torazame]|uniref:G-protein coupled receptors family 2 profile 2 domain-containing protein n=1 Tax=Scyliorhinus torazame TaxID=75743 RepID=A0A401PD91_SCYTO|nr:hypothetical protein [Scyliorhinus torazame]